MANSVLAKMAVEITANTAKFNTSLKETNSKLDTFSKNISGIGKTLIAGFGLYEIGSGIIDVTSKFQKFEAVLTNTLGDSSAAQKALRDIEAFAANTPFQVDEVTAAYVRWANQGLEPTIDKMTKLGDIGSSLGAGFEQTAEAFKDLLVGQTKRIEEVGISATQANGKIQLSFKGVNIEIDKSKEGVQKALDVYSQLNGVLGTSDAISKTLGGRISNLKDSFDLLLKTIGESSSGPLFTIINVLTRLTQGLAYVGIQAKITAKGLESLTSVEFEKVFAFGETESLKKIADVIKEINDLNSNAFFKDVEENKKKFIALLVKEGESQSDALILWQKYVDIRLKAANGEDDAIAKKRELVKAIKEEAGAVKEVNLERAKALARAANVTITPPTVAGFDTSTLKFQRPDPTIFDQSHVADSMANAQNSLADAISNTNSKLLEQQNYWVGFGLAAGGAIANAISSNEDFGRSVASVASDIISSSSKVISEFLAIGIARAFSINPIAGAAIAAAGLGVIAGLLRKVGHSKGGTVDYVRPQFARASVGSVQNSVQFVIKGQDLYGTLSNYEKASGYTKG